MDSSLKEESADKSGVLSVTARRQVLHNLVPVASSAVHSQLDAFVISLAAQLMALSDQSTDPKEANRSFNAANLLKKNGATLHFLISTHLEKSLRDEIRAAEQLSPIAPEKFDEV